MYKILSTDAILRIADGSNIPKDPLNRDYVAYQQWVQQGNVPDAADKVVAIPVSMTVDKLTELLTSKNIITAQDIATKEAAIDVVVPVKGG